MKFSDKRFRNFIREKYNGKCAYCGEELHFIFFHIDHINPNNRPTVTLDNMEDYINDFNPSCKECNISKNRYSIEDWREVLRLKPLECYKESFSFRMLFKYNRIEFINTPIVFYFETFLKQKDA